ncbi:MAG: ABC transporter permease [Pyrinomonadaceae bacterium]
MNILNSFQSEWLKKRKSMAATLVVVGALFSPLMYLIRLLREYEKLPALYTREQFWITTWNVSWQSMNMLLLPIGIILAVGFVMQIEYNNNAWKQLHSTPQSYATIYFSKFAVLLVMTIQVFVLFNLAVYVVTVIPSVIFGSVPYPTAEMPVGKFLTGNLNYFLHCLPILSLQYLLGFQFRNFLIPLGAGFSVWLVGVISMSWKHSYVFPYLHGGLDIMREMSKSSPPLPIGLNALSLIYFAVFIIAGFVLYVMKAEKG